jgi:hypothetical protein
MAYSGIFAPLNNDDYAPQSPNFSHQQWENYGIYSIACISKINGIDPELRKFMSWQTQYVRPIPVDFRLLVETYPGI